MVAQVMSSLYFAAVHGAVLVPLLWIIGVVLLVGGVIALLRGAVIAGVVLIIIGILLGGLNVF
jgi:hypothetical protein